MTAGDFWDRAGTGAAPPAAPGPRAGGGPGEGPGGGGGRLIAAVVGSVLAALLVTALVIAGVSGKTVDGRAVADGQPATTTTATTATTSATPMPRALTVDGLPSLLSPPDQVARLVGVPSMRVGHRVQDLDEPNPGQSFSPAECIGARFSGMAAALGSSGQLGFYELRTKDDDSGAVLVDQGALLYPSPAAAADALENYRALWRRCAGTVNTTESGRDYTIDVGPIVDAGDGISTLTTTAGVGDRFGQRGIAAKGPVLVDCQFLADQQPSADVAAVVRAILARIPA
jgi:hypothetical protein